ncbi:MAG: hypothetical protein KKG00_15200 [Bacteroidetes bacterium]|nr:hypothetical protein [Bacteroidota bacterium]
MLSERRQAASWRPTWRRALTIPTHTSFRNTANQVLGQHDQWAEWTLGLGGIGAVLQGANLFFLTDKRWAVGLVAAVLLGAGYAVSQAGHFGSQLVYIEVVGPQGQHLESEEGHSH